MTELFTTLLCEFCLRMDIATIIANLTRPVHKEISLVWDDFGDPKNGKLNQIFGNLIPLPTVIKEEDGIREVIKGVYANLNDNLKLLESLY